MPPFTLALGNGATTAAFTVRNDVLLTSLPFPEPDRLLVVIEELAHERATLYPSHSNLDD